MTVTEWCKVQPYGTNCFEMNRIFLFDLKDTLRNVVLTFDINILDDGEYMNMRYNAVWNIQLEIGDMTFSKLDSKINGEYLRQKDDTIVKRYKEIFETLRKVKRLEIAEVALTELIIQECDTDAQQMLRHSPEMPDYYKHAVKPGIFTVPLILDYNSPHNGHSFQQMKMRFEAMHHFDKIVDSAFYLQVLQERDNEIFDFSRDDYSCFACSYKHSVLAVGDYILADKCIYMFCKCEKDHSGDSIEYIFPSQIIEKTMFRSLYWGKAKTSFAKKVRSGVYRFDFQQTESNQYIFTSDFRTKRESGCIVELYWRTLSQEIHKDGLTFLQHYRDQVSYN